MHAPAVPAYVSRTYTSADGLKLHYRDYQGPADAPFTVICVPGLTRNARDFEALAPHLATKYRVWCLDLRGRGLSAYATDPMTYVPATYVRDVIALFQQTALKQAAFVGTSLGGIVSTLFAAVMPAKVLGVVVNDIGPELDPAGLARIGSLVGRSRPIATWDDAIAAIEDIDRTVFPDYGPADWDRVARRRFVENPDGTLRSDYDLNISKPFAKPGLMPDLWPFFRRLEAIPALVIRGALSDLLSTTTVTRMTVALPRLAAVEVPNRGHAPYLDEPMALAAIDDFLAGLPHRVGALTAIRRTLGAWRFMIQLKLSGVA